VKLMLPELTAWWISQMRTLLLGRKGSERKAALVIAVDCLETEPKPLSGALLLRQGGNETRLQELGTPFRSTQAERLPVFLRLPPGTVLSRELMLPQAASRNLRDLIGFEMDRFTPFTASELFWDVSRPVSGKTSGKLSLNLFIAPRAPVEALLRRLKSLGLSPSHIEARNGHIALAAARSRSQRYLRIAPWAFCGLLALACVATPFIRQQFALNNVEQIIARNSTAAQTAMSLRRQLMVTASGRAAIASARKNGDALRMLANLTAALPDGTWLADLTEKSSDLTIDGQSDNAARLIGLLSSAPGLSNPSFSAPVTRTADGKADIFSLHMSLTP
jgi:general secretion pathway protein L